MDNGIIIIGDIPWIDLGLPSGRLWATENAPGYHTFEKAVHLYGKLLPSGTAMTELIEYSTVEWDPERRGVSLTGPNGRELFIPAAGNVGALGGEPAGVGFFGQYWTRMEYLAGSLHYGVRACERANRLVFSEDYLFPLDLTNMALRLSVRLCRERANGQLPQ